MDPSSSFASGSNGRQKRVLPSRTRRGGPGVGSCDTDVMILEHQKRRFETESIVPPNTPFLLTTNAEVFSGAGGPTEPSVTTVTNERYFDRPDVLKAYREQLTIQTPSFVYVADNPSVGGRFRPRGPEDAQVDTSDAAYERRHRKYETFEKRQRLREKEKLKHEQYKLKERIEQLRVMDASAFLALPASHFSPAPPVSEEYGEDGTLNLSGAQTNGVSPHNEGERRRKEMLDIALALEERYRVLLPPERIRRLQSQPIVTREQASPPPVSAPAPTPFRHADSDMLEFEREENIIVEPHDRKQEKLKIKFKFIGSASQSPAPTTTSRTSRRSARASAPPGQKPTTKRRARTFEASRSPTPPMSPPRLVDSSRLSPCTTSGPSSPVVRPQIAEELVEEHLPLDSDVRPPRVGSALASEAGIDREDSLLSSRAHTPPPLTPPQKLSPIPPTRPAPAPQLDPTVLGEEAYTEEISSSERRTLVPSSRPGDTLAEVAREHPPASARSSPESSSARQQISTAPRLNPMETELQAHSSTVPGLTEEGSRLLELANAVQVITAPPRKRQKVRHQEPSKPREVSEPRLQPTAGPELGLFTPASEKIIIPNGKPGAVSPPPMPMSISAGPSMLSASPPPPVSGLAFASISAPISISDAPARRRYLKKTVSYVSSDTGQTMYTRSLLLIAGVRGGIRQTQRHQTAFGVKVPEEISDARDFELPAEFWPEEELMKYYRYYGLEVADSEQDEHGILETVVGGEHLGSPTFEEDE